MQGLFAGLSIVSKVAGGMAGRAEAMNNAARAESEARLAETQALQRDTQARGELDRYLSTVRAARAANGLSASSPNAYLLEGEARDVSDEERLTERANYRQQAANMRAAAKSYRAQGKMSLITGVLGGGMALGEYGSSKGWF